MQTTPETSRQLTQTCSVHFTVVGTHNNVGNSTLSHGEFVRKGWGPWGFDYPNPTQNNNKSISCTFMISGDWISIYSVPIFIFFLQKYSIV